MSHSTANPAEALLERLLVRDLVEKWVVWRDARQWDLFRTVWHADGRMLATWAQGTYEEFIERSEKGWANGARILHFLGGNVVDISANRAISQTKMTIAQRAKVEGVVCDVVCTGRFYDFFEKKADTSGTIRWGLVLRQPIYEKDRLDVVDPSATLRLDADLLASFPEGYRHLAYLQTRIGYTVKRDMPGIAGPEVEQLYREGAQWLAGGPLGR